MSAAVKEIVVEARSMRVGDPSIQVFHTVVRAQGTWEETHGSRQQLQSYLLGLKTALVMLGFPAHLLSWDIPEQWNEPTGRRWTLQPGGTGEAEDLDSQDNAIKI